MFNISFWFISGSLCSFLASASTQMLRHAFQRHTWAITFNVRRRELCTDGERDVSKGPFFCSLYFCSDGAGDTRSSNFDLTFSIIVFALGFIFSVQVVEGWLLVLVLILSIFLSPIIEVVVVLVRAGEAYFSKIPFRAYFSKIPFRFCCKVYRFVN